MYNNNHTIIKHWNNMANDYTTGPQMRFLVISLHCMGVCILYYVFSIKGHGTGDSLLRLHRRLPTINLVYLPFRLQFITRGL